MNRSSKDGEKSEKGMSASFITGALALAFLIIGYQTALFMHRAASLRILSSVPDTVYVYVPSGDSDSSPESPSDISAVSYSGSGRKVSSPAAHSDSRAVQRKRDVVSSFTPRRYENFRFDPNTASAEEFERLGFSSRQAEAILKYRAGGGRFRRKSDFAKSYVVSDSVYRRLEPYIDIPLLDLNTADSAAFDALPGIGGYFASKMVSYRKALGGYSFKEQLLDIYRFDREKYDALSDLVVIATPPKPFGLWTLPADSLRLHPYVRNYNTARAIVLYRENNPASALTAEGLAEAGILDEETAAKLARCRIDD